MVFDFPAFFLFFCMCFLVFFCGGLSFYFFCHSFCFFFHLFFFLLFLFFVCGLFISFVMFYLIFFCSLSSYLLSSFFSASYLNFILLSSSLRLPFLCCFSSLPLYPFVLFPHLHSFIILPPASYLLLHFFLLGSFPSLFSPISPLLHYSPRSLCLSSFLILHLIPPSILFSFCFLIFFISLLFLLLDFSFFSPILLSLSLSSSCSSSSLLFPPFIPFILSPSRHLSFFLLPHLLPFSSLLSSFSSSSIPSHSSSLIALFLSSYPHLHLYNPSPFRTPLFLFFFTKSFLLRLASPPFEAHYLNLGSRGRRNSCLWRRERLQAC